MVDVTRRGFLALLGVAAASTALPPHLVRVLEAATATPETLPLSTLPPLTEVDADCFISWRNDRLALGALKDASVIWGANVPRRSGTSGRGRVIAPVRINFLHNTVVQLQVQRDELSKRAVDVLRSSSDIGFEVDSIVDSEYVRLTTRHAVPSEVEVDNALVSFQLALVDDLVYNRSKHSV